MDSNQDEINANGPLDGESSLNAAGGNETSGKGNLEIVQFFFLIFIFLKILRKKTIRSHSNTS